MNKSNIFVSKLQVRTAVKFLQNPKVHSSPLKQKQEFLRRKGLTESEVTQACEAAGLNLNDAEVSFVPRQNDFTSVPIGNGYPYYQTQLYRPTLFGKVKETLSTVALFGAATYCIYWFYKVRYSAQVIKGILFYSILYRLQSCFRNLSPRFYSVEAAEKKRSKSL